jgi:hypothetical protein
MSVFDDFPHGTMLEICQYLIGTVADLEKFQSNNSLLLPYVHHPMAVTVFTFNIAPHTLPYKLSKLTVQGIMGPHSINIIRTIRGLRELHHDCSRNTQGMNPEFRPTYSFDNLKTLVLTGYSTLSVLELKGTLKRLHTLTIRDCYLPHDTIVFIARLPALRTLDLIKCSFETPDVSIPVLTKVPLRFLDIRLRYISYENQLMICKMPIKYLCISEQHAYKLMLLFNDPVNDQFTAHIMMPHPGQ